MARCGLALVSKVGVRSTNQLLISVMTICLLPNGNVQAAASQEQSTEIYRTAASILALSNIQANRTFPARLRGVVTQSMDAGLTIQDRTAGIWVYLDHGERFAAGDDIEVEGTVGPGLFAPVLNGSSVHKYGRAPLPKPIVVSFRQLSTGNLDCQYVSVTGLVRSAGIRRGASTSQKLWLRIGLEDGSIDATFPADNADSADQLIGAVVRIDAPAMCSKNRNRQITAATLSVPSMDNLKVLRRPPSDLFAMTLSPVDNMMKYRSGTDYYHRVRVSGIVTYYNPGENLILEDGGHALLVKTGQVKTITPGDRVEAVGFPAPQDSGPFLDDAVLRRISSGSPPQPTPVRIVDVSSGALNNNLVSVEGHLLRQVHEPFREVLMLQDESTILLAELSQYARSDAFPQLREGSKIRISGICTLEVEGTWNYGLNSAYAVRYKILMRSPADVQIMAAPTWWSTRNLLLLAAVLAVLMLAFLTQVILGRVERWKLKAVLEARERLAHEIHDTLAQSFAGIGFQLQAIRKAIPGNMLQLKAQVELAQDLARHSHKEARRSFEPLRPNLQQGFGLLCSLEASARKIVEGGSVNVIAKGGEIAHPFSPDMADTLLRIGLEAIANAIRHADPTNLTISLKCERNTVQLAVQDDGSGFVKSGDLLGFGLRGMRKLAADISAKLDIISLPGQGTSVIVTAPLPPVNSWAGVLKGGLCYAREQILHVKAKREADPHSHC